MIIQNWNKCKGIVYKGHAITETYISRNHKTYCAKILDYEDNTNTIDFEIETDTDRGGFKWKTKSYHTIIIDDRKRRISRSFVCHTNAINNIKKFLRVFEIIIEDYIKLKGA
jgi:hypothetical protein